MSDFRASLVVMRPFGLSTTLSSTQTEHRLHSTHRLARLCELRCSENLTVDGGGINVSLTGGGDLGNEETTGRFILLFRMR
jgi:hypothetical protein